MAQKRSQVLGPGVIVVLILALVVLGLLSYFLFREGGVFGKFIAECESRAGTCIGEGKPCDGRVIKALCPKERPACCVSLMGETDG